MDRLKDIFEIPGKGEELSKKVGELVKALLDNGWDLGINEQNPFRQISIRPKEATPKTTDLGYINFQEGFVRVYNGNPTLSDFLADYKFN